MPDITSNPTYLPDGPDYFNYSYSGGSVPFPGMGWGGPTSPAYATMRPRDFMAKQNIYPGNAAFAPPGGFNFGDPLTNVFGNMGMSALFGTELRPFQTPGIPPVDYARSRQRFGISMAMQSEILAQNAPVTNRMGGMFQTMPGQIGYDMFNPGGSQSAAFQTIYGNLGSSFGGGLQDQARASMDVLKQLNNEFQIKTGPRAGMIDHNRTYGFDRVESADNLDAAARYGTGGASMEKITEAANKKDGSLGKMMRDNNRIFSQAQDIFGKDKGADELASLMNTAIDGFAGLDANKASELLNRIQSTSRAVSIASKAFGEFSMMFSNLAKDSHIGGSAQLNAMSNAAVSAKIDSQIGRQGGDMVTSDQNRMMAVRAELNLKSLDSPVLNRAAALALSLDDMTDSQRAAYKVKGMGTGADVQSRLKAIMETGNTRKIDEFVNQAMQGIPVSDRQDIMRRSMNMSPEDRERTQAMGGAFANPAMLPINRFYERLTSNINARLSPDLKAALGKNGVGDILPKFSNPQDMLNGRKAQAKIDSMDELKGLTQKQRDALKTAITTGSQIINDTGALGMSFQNITDLSAAARLSVQEKSDQNKAMTAQTMDKIRRDELLQTYIKEISGEGMRGFDAKKAMEIFSAHGAEVSDIFKGGKFDSEKAMALAKKMGMEATGAEDLKKIMEAVNTAGGSPDSVIGQAEAEYNKNIKAGMSPAEAKSKQNQFLLDKAAKVRDQLNGSNTDSPYHGISSVLGAAGMTDPLSAMNQQNMDPSQDPVAGHPGSGGGKGEDKNTAHLAMCEKYLKDIAERKSSVFANTASKHV